MLDAHLDRELRTMWYSWVEAWTSLKKNPRLNQPLERPVSMHKSPSFSLMINLSQPIPQKSMRSVSFLPGVSEIREVPTFLELGHECARLNKDELNTDTALDKERLRRQLQKSRI